MNIDYEHLYNLLERESKSGETRFYEIQLMLTHQGFLKPREHEMVIAAMVLAYECHQGQRDKAGKPYFEHCFRVAKPFIDSRAPYEIIASALLHDVMEDGKPAPYFADLKIIFGGTEVCHTVSQLTRLTNVTYSDYIDSIRSLTAIQVKISDLLDNLNLLRILHISNADIARTEKYTKALVTLYRRQKEVIDADTF